ncbi:hypothetical protein EUGRSUZ_E00821 [Eucalyptus grandis]|uniref:Uncharacterized protein n=2 Tax=Eucalyptus grandis TaxID=71139 RepID=A0ACC3KSP2_EUCGR|nr:hypothetical protein EUGRSUZ_E00821 [Eucalyptus grandis]
MEHRSRPLNLCHVDPKLIAVNRAHMLIHGAALLILIHYRASFFFAEEASSPGQPTTLAWLIIFLGELMLSLTWFLHQAFRWRPMSRTAFPKRLPGDGELPSIDVLVCTADPDKEPTVAVMNTVISAMALDYPPEKLHVYLSDDGGSLLTLHGMREAYDFARRWLPFCKRFGIKTRCPKAYFMDDEDVSASVGYESEKKEVKEKYELFEAHINGYRNRNYGESRDGRQDHPSTIEVIHGNSSDEVVQADQQQMPLLVYVSREKRPSYPHNFKAGALNVLLRVSGVISNSPYVLVLDCDMYCNDPSSARRAMCFHLDPTLSPSLSFVQFPQSFHNISKNDIYDSKIRSPFGTLLCGMDGLQGPLIAGTGFYIKRESLYSEPMQEANLMDLKAIFGHSNEFIKHVQWSDKLNKNILSEPGTVCRDTEHLASCHYENGTKWGQEVGFKYGSVAEDFFTSFALHCKGWKSVYCRPSQPQFLGASTTNLNDLLVQVTRWSSGLAQVGFSRFSPPIYGPWRMSILQSMCYTELAFFPLYCLPLCCLATIPQICLFNGVPIYPEVSSSLFLVYCFVFLSSLSKHLYEVVVSGHSVRTFINEQRIWMIHSVTTYLYGSINAVLTKTGVRRASFLPTSKVADDEQMEMYEKGVFDFRTSIVFLAPIVALVMLSMASFVGGIARVLVLGGWDKLLAQIALSFFILVMSYPVIEGMVRSDKGRIPLSAAVQSALLSVALLLLGSALLVYREMYG